MLPDETPLADDPVEWLEYAKADLVLAQSELLPGGFYEHLCFHAQQAVEKALKGILLQKRVDFPYTHNLELLTRLLPQVIASHEVFDDVEDLNKYAVVIRYPGGPVRIAEPEWQRVVTIARAVVQIAESIIIGKR